MEFITDVWNYLKERKKWWLLPAIITLLLVGGLILLAHQPATAPLIYSIF
jgi:drug/metabolite transporter superfamily protein YnfA